MCQRATSLSIALLVYNEAETVASVLAETLDFCRTLCDAEIIVIDDGSTDGSAEAIAPFVDGERVRLIRHDTNRGMGAGLKTAIAAATKAYFTFNAADGQLRPHDLGGLLDGLSSADIVLGAYEQDARGLGRALLSRGFRGYIRWVGGIDFSLQGTYLFPTNTAKVIAPAVETDTFYFSFELIRRGRERGMTVTSRPIRVAQRKQGRSKVATIRRVLKVGKDVARSGFARWYFFQG